MFLGCAKCFYCDDIYCCETCQLLADYLSMSDLERKISKEVSYLMEVFADIISRKNLIFENTNPSLNFNSDYDFLFCPSRYDSFSLYNLLIDPYKLFL